MAKCRKIRKTTRKLCVGDLDQLISLIKRTLKAPKTGVDFTHESTKIEEVWCFIKTLRGQEQFANVEQGPLPTHAFHVLYDERITKEYDIEFENKRYDILDVEDLDENHEFMILRARIKGKKSIGVNRP